MADTAAILARLDALEARNDRLEGENQTLRRELTAMQAIVTPEPSTSAAANTPDSLSRRRVLQRGMQVAAASLAAGALLHETTQPAAAESFSFVAVARTVDAGPAILAEAPGPDHATILSSSTGGTAVYGIVDGSKPAIFGLSRSTGAGVRGESSSANGAVEGKSNNANGSGVMGAGGRHGVVGASSHGSGYGVYGNNLSNIGVLGEGLVGVKGTCSVSNYTGVVGEHTGSVGYGVLGVGTGAGVGVTGRSPAGEGVRGEGKTGVIGTTFISNQSGVSGSSSGTNGIGVNGTGNSTDGFGVKGTGAVGVGAFSSTHGYEAVYAVHLGDYGFGVVGVGQGAGAGLFGQNAEGDGVYAEGKFGLRVKSTATGGYGAIIEGGKAQLRLVPNTTAGKPTSGSHLKGELVMDKNAALWVCTVSGTPGTWRKVSTTTS